MVAPPYVAFRDASVGELRSLFSYLTDPLRVPGGGGGYSLRSLCAYGNTINPSYAGAFVRSGPRPQSLASNITFGDLGTVELDFRSRGYYPRIVTSPGSHVAEWSYLTFDILFETGAPATRLGGVIDVALLSTYVSQINADTFAKKPGNRGMIVHIDGFAFGDGLAFISVISDIYAYGGFFGRYPLRPDSWQVTDRIVVGDTPSAWENHIPHRSMRHGWVRPDVIVPLLQEDTPVGLFTEFLSLWKGSVYAPWPEPLDPDTFDGGVTAYAPLSARELDDLTNPDSNPSWPLYIGAKSFGSRTVYSLVTTPPGQIDPLPRTIRTFSAWNVVSESKAPKSLALAHGDFGTLSRAAGATSKLRPDSPNLDIGHGAVGGAISDLNEPQLFHPADTLDSDVTAIWQRDALLRAEGESLRGWGEEPEEVEPKPWSPSQRKGGAPHPDSPPLAPTAPILTIEKTVKATNQEWAVDALFKEALRVSGARMMQVALCKDGRLVYAKSFTYAEEGYPEPSLVAKLCIGSCQKPLVTMALLRQMGASAINTPLESALRITPVPSVNTTDLGLLTLGHMMTHRSGLNVDWDRMRKQLNPPHPDQYTLKAGDYSRYLQATSDAFFLATPPTPLAKYSNYAFDILGEALGAQSAWGVSGFERAFLSAYSTPSRSYSHADMHIREGSWPALRSAGDFHRQTRLPGWYDAASVSPDYLGTTNGFDAGSGEFVMNVIELARIVSRLSPDAKAGPLLTDAERPLIESDPYGGTGGLTFLATIGPGDPPTTGDLVLWHNGEVPAGSGWIEHRRPNVGTGPNWTAALLINMETDGYANRTPLFSDAITLLRAMDQAGLLTTEDLFDAFA